MLPAPLAAQSFAPGFDPGPAERLQIRDYIDEARTWSHHFFSMRIVHPFNPEQSRYLVIGLEVVAIEAPPVYQGELWTAQLVGRDVPPNEPFKIRRRDMDMPPRVSILDLNSDGALDVLICRDRDKQPNPWSITFDGTWRVLSEDEGERPECASPSN